MTLGEGSEDEGRSKREARGERRERKQGVERAGVSRHLPHALVSGRRAASVATPDTGPVTDAAMRRLRTAVLLVVGAGDAALAYYCNHNLCDASNEYCCGDNLCCDYANSSSGLWLCILLLLLLLALLWLLLSLFWLPSLRHRQHLLKLLCALLRPRSSRVSILPIASPPR